MRTSPSLRASQYKQGQLAQPRRQQEQHGQQCYAPLTSSSSSSSKEESGKEENGEDAFNGSMGAWRGKHGEGGSDEE
eukprot:1157408-Pelagomonas_calceolata.AAC.17